MDSFPLGGNNGCGKEGGFVMSEDNYSAWVETDYLFGSQSMLAGYWSLMSKRWTERLRSTTSILMFKNYLAIQVEYSPSGRVEPVLFI